MQDAFAALGLEPRFHIDAKALERAWLDRSRAVHPDRFAGKPDAERRSAAEQTVALNDAYRAIKEPYDRAVFLLLRAGVELARLDQRLLVELMEAREAAESSADDKARVIADARGRFEARMAEVGEALAVVDARAGGYAARSAELDRAARALAEAKTLARLVADLGGGKLIASLPDR